MNVYKVVQKYGRKRYSWLASGHAFVRQCEQREGRTLVYQQDKVTKPKRGMGPLYATTSLDQAKYLATLDDTSEIWLADAEVVEHKKYDTVLCSEITLRELVEKPNESV